MSESLGYEAVKLLAQAKHERAKGRFDSALGFLNQVIAFGERDAEFIPQYPYREAHIELYRVYEAIGEIQEALAHYKKAIQLGVEPEQLLH